ncbi:Mss4-like protein [Pseudomassariella vexata]|uniref:Mss4-like protein n=1 Tax=Pseudomassariella vexata TaxID=1141098 RepID=A0A1Y2EKE5_9PEZI|nr:Mss4-like protein [Pseudomassariella vexata]ORY71315.1 Mss4-like protein [Pseudomassariella vexata]
MVSETSVKKRKIPADEHYNEEHHATSKDGLAHPNKAHNTVRTHEEEEKLKTTEEGSWRNNPPYRTHDENETCEKKHTAQCKCGRIKYWLSREKPLASKFCHCKDCQSLHGAPFQWAAVFEKNDLHFENGAKGLAFYSSEKNHTHHDLPCKVSCSYCHAPILDEGRNMVLIFPAIIKFVSPEAKKAFDPTMHIFYSRRVVDIKDGKPKWSELDKQSELIKDVD